LELAGDVNRVFHSSSNAFQVATASDGWGIEAWTSVAERPTDLLSWLSAVLSNLVSNVPACCCWNGGAGVPAANCARETDGWRWALTSTFAGQPHRFPSLPGQPDRVESAAPGGVC